VFSISPRNAFRFCSFKVSTFAESLSMRMMFLFLVPSSFASARPIPPLPRIAYVALIGFRSNGFSSMIKPPDTSYIN
jgi:hypothetical protein